MISAEEREAFERLVLSIEEHSKFQDNNKVLKKSDVDHFIDERDEITEYMLIGTDSKGEYADEITLVIKYIPYVRKLKKGS
ncbi:hypothetical protein [Bacillus sp. XF8]|uniref:hypothetical protein n=1 Tax=Bacillus sp. XF8 TaxID=2819289 RepID=UPI001AA06A4B|nr:hypothetical protein [Bacillus sp. XF8]MBO1583161.1 hypothetical protein [Bacillus sp. XF8]